MPMVKRMKIAHPRLNLFWSCDVQGWTSDESWITEWSPIEYDECEEIADREGGIIEHFSRFSNLTDTFARTLGPVQHAAE